MQTRVHPALSEMIRRFAGELRQDPVRDAELLATFAQQQDDEAFAALVARHGPVVWGVCSRGLNDPNDAEDAFQATFLALARQSQVLADRVQSHETLAGWLYLTAQRIAHNLRRARMRRCSHELKAAAAWNERADRPVEPVAELGVVLDEELGQLPARFRDPLILCYFQEKTHADAARQLGCPVGTVSGRLARGCELLRARLARRGIALAVGQVAVAVAMIGSTARAAVPVSAVPTGLTATTVAAARSFGAGGATTEVAQLALGVAPVKAGLKTKLIGLLVVAALGMTAAAAAMSQGPVHADAPHEVLAVAPQEAREPNDAFGDPLPEGAVSRLGTLRFRTGKMGQAASIAFGPGGKRLLSVHGDDVVHVWNPVTGREERSLDAPQYCATVSATPEGRRLVGIGASEVWAWDLAADPPAVLWKAKLPPRFLRGNVQISPDGRLVACGDEGKASVVLLDAATGESVRTLAATGSGFAFSPDSKLLATWHRKPPTDTSAVTDVSVWVAADGKHKYTIEVAPKGGPVATVAFSPDGKTVATAAGDRRLRVWDAANGMARADLATDADPCACVGFSPDGTLIEAGGGRVRFWDHARERQAKPPVKAEDAADTYLLSADGTRLARAGLFGVGVRDVATGREIGAGAGMPDGLVHSATFAPDNRSVALAVYGESTGGSLYLWDATGGKLRGRVGVGSGRIIGGIDFGADGTVSAASVPLYEKPAPPMRVVTWAADLGRERGSYALSAGTRCGAVSPDGRHVAVATGDRIVLCDRETGKEGQTLPLKCQATSLAFSADGSHIGALDSAAKRVIVCSLAGNRQTVWPPAGAKLETLLAPLTLSPDGRLFAVHVGGRVQVVETATGTELWRPDVRVNGLPVQEFTFAPDGRTFAAAGADGTVRVWEVASGEERYRFPGHRSSAFSVAYSPDSRRLASTSYDSTALVWDVERLPAPPKGRPTPDELWAALTGREAAPAYRAVAALVAAPADAVPLLRSKLVPPAAPPERVRQWLADLGSDEFKAREDASRELALRGDLVVPDLKRALAETDSAEVRARLERLLARTGARAPDGRAVIRGVEALERMAAEPPARQLLRELAGTPAESLLGREARAAYRRLPPAPPK